MLLKRADKLPTKKDVIVIGGGLAGMTAANILAKNNYQVLLLESHNKLGGFATWFYRDNHQHIFDISLHGFPVGMLKTCRKYWNKEIADLIVPLKDVRFYNPQFSLSTNFTKDDYIRHLEETFHVPRENATAFFDYLSQMNFYDQNNLTNGELFERFFPGRNDVTRFLMEPITYANGSTLEDPAITYGIVFSNFMNKGVYTFKGGTDHLIQLMKEEMIRNGVDIKLNSPVQKIVIENNQVKGIQTEKETVTAPVVLSNANIMSTINKLCGPHYFSDEFKAKCQAVRQNSSSCQVYIGLKKGETIPFIGDLIFTSKANTYNTDELLNFTISSRTFSIYYPEGRPGTTHYAIVSSTNAHYDDWAHLSEEDYQQAKQHMIDETIDELDFFLPGIKSKINYTEAATPLTIERFTLHPQGTSFGTKFEGLAVSMNLQNEVAGLFHAGSVGIIMSGWLGAANYGVIQANNIASFLHKQNLNSEELCHNL